MHYVLHETLYSYLKLIGTNDMAADVLTKLLASTKHERFCLMLGLVSQTAPGCVTCHTRHSSVTHFRPKCANVVEVALVTPPTMYIISHAKGTYFPLARITIMTPP